MALPSRTEDRDVYDLVEAVAEEWGLSVATLIGTDRRRRVMLPRHVVFYLLYTDLSCSLLEIGYVMERDHTSALHGIRRIDRELAASEELRQRIEAIRSRLRSGVAA